MVFILSRAIVFLHVGCVEGVGWGDFVAGAGGLVDAAAHLGTHAGTGEPGTESAGVAQVLAVLLLTDDAVIVLYNHVVSHLAPAFYHLVADLAAVVGQVGNGGIAVTFQQGKGSLLDLGLVGKVAGLQRVAHLL